MDTFEACANPICELPLTGPGKRHRRHCDRGCRLTHWILKRAASLLAPLEQSKAWGILYRLDQEVRREPRPLLEDERLKPEFQKRVTEIVAWALARSPGE